MRQLNFVSYVNLYNEVALPIYFIVIQIYTKRVAETEGLC
jgi:hypothetical protein